MKNALAQLQVLASKVDRRYLQFAYFIFVVIGAFFTTGAPSDGGGGPF